MFHQRLGRRFGKPIDVMILASSMAAVAGSLGPWLTGSIVSMLAASRNRSCWAAGAGGSAPEVGGAGEWAAGRATDFGLAPQGRDLPTPAHHPSRTRSAAPDRRQRTCRAAVRREDFQCHRADHAASGERPERQQMAPPRTAGHHGDKKLHHSRSAAWSRACFSASRSACHCVSRCLVSASSP